VCGEGGGHAATTRSDDEHVDNVIEAADRHFGVAVLMANPAISSAAGL
jgi:hypothetical protein